MAGVKEQRTCIKFCFKLNKTAAETHRMLKEAFGEQALSQARTFEWFKHFKDGRESVEDDKHSGRPSTCTTPEMIAKVREVILEDRRQTIHDVCNRVGLSYGSCQRILADELNMRRIAAKFVPRLLNSDQRDHRVQVCTELQEAVRHDPNFLSRVITGDESWVYDYDPETKQQSTQWKTPSSPRPKKARQVRSNIKSMLIIFLDIRGIVHKEFVPPGQTVNGKFYCEVLRRLRENVRRKRPEMWKNGNWLLHHDNAPAHTSLVVREFLTKNNVTTVPHPAYSPDLAPCDFYVFPKMKLRLKGRCFASIEEVQAESQQILNTLTPADFNECFQKWQNRWDRCIQAQGDYFEGDGGN